MFYNKIIFKRCFDYRGKRWYKNLKRIPLYLKNIRYLIKYGYDEYATWETFSWFIHTMRAILTDYKLSHSSYPILIDNYPMNSADTDDESKALREKNNQIWDDIISRMIELLDLMDENNPKYEEYCDFRKTNKEMNEAKDEFFKLFSEHFWNLWD